MKDNTFFYLTLGIWSMAFILGLTIGYVIKYKLDKRYVF